MKENEKVQSPKRALVLVSGGLDSSTALYWANSQTYDLYVLSIDYYLRPEKEKDAVKYLIDSINAELIEINLPFLKEIDDLRDFNYPLQNLKDAPDGYIPMKNLIFYSIAAYYCEIYDIDVLIGGQILSDSKLYPDASMKYFQTIKSLIDKGGNSFRNHHREIKLKFPLKNKSKEEVIEMAIELKVPLSHTWSCYENEKKPCGECKGCMERKTAFQKFGETDPLFQ